MRRREFIAGIAGAGLAWPLASARGQERECPRIGMLRRWPRSSARLAGSARCANGLRELGYVEGKNIAIEFRWAETVEQLPEIAAELRSNERQAIIFATSSTEDGGCPGVDQKRSPSCSNHVDSVGDGLCGEPARPGGNITGLSMLMTE